MAGPYPFDFLAGRTTLGKSPQGKIVPGRFDPSSQDPAPRGSRYNLLPGFDEAVEGPDIAAAIYELQAAVKTNSPAANKLRSFYGLTSFSFDGLDRDFAGQTLVCNDALYVAGMVAGGSIWHDFRQVLDSVAPPVQPPPPPLVNPPAPPPVGTPKLSPLSPASVRAEELKAVLATRDENLSYGVFFDRLMPSNRGLTAGWSLLKPFAVEALRFYRLARKRLGDTREIPQEDR